MYARVRARNVDTRNKKYDWQIFHSDSRINKSCQSKNQPTDSNGLMYASWLFLLRTRHKNMASEYDILQEMTF